jgi:hypothetical protein
VNFRNCRTRARHDLLKKIARVKTIGIILALDFKQNWRINNEEAANELMVGVRRRAVGRKKEKKFPNKRDIEPSRSQRGKRWKRERG